MGSKQFPICQEAPLAELFRAANLFDIATTALDAPADFANFDDYWSPFLRGEGACRRVLRHVVRR